MGLQTVQAEDHGAAATIRVSYAHVSFDYADHHSLVNQKYEWEPKIWDPQAASENIRSSFRSPPNSLPCWLRWEEGTKLVGVPEGPTAPIQITALADVSKFVPRRH